MVVKNIVTYTINIVCVHWIHFCQNHRAAPSVYGKLPLYNLIGKHSLHCQTVSQKTDFVSQLQ